MNYQMIAMDMDGTLLTADKKILPQTALDLKEAAVAGKFVTLCTGRGIPEILEFDKELAPVRYGVLESGALIYDFKENAVIHEEKVMQDTVYKIVDVAKKFDGMLHYHAARDCIVQKEQAQRMADFGMQDFQETFLRIGKLVEDMSREAEFHESIPKVNIYFRTPEDRAQGYELLKALPLTFAFAETTSLEMTPKGVSKGSGLTILAKHLGVDLEAVIAVGDADNDREMLETAGLAVAMGNAIDSIKTMADAITADSDHNGVGEAIHKYLLG